MHAQLAALPPDPIALARSLEATGAERSAILGDGHGLVYVGCDPDRRSDAIDPFDPVEAEEGELARVPRWVGVVPYEAFRHLERPRWSAPEDRPAPLVASPSWWRFPAMLRVDRSRGEVLAVGVDRAAVALLVERAAVLASRSRPSEVFAVDDEPLALHEARIRAAKELIAAGDLYQVNLARRIRVRARADASVDLFERSSRAAPTPFASMIRDGDLAIVSTSPEMLLEAEPDFSTSSRRFGALRTAPIKGTRPRGRDAIEDAELARALDEDPKERAELTMIIDVERHDLARVSIPGSVRMIASPRVVTHRTIHHRAAVIASRARAGVSREDVLRAVLPSGSVTGAPKVRAMEVIRALEPHRRGLYTGAIGFVAHDGRVSLSMAIRTLVIRGDEGEYFAGGGIVEGSDPAREVDETRWKSLQLTRILANSAGGK